MNKENSIKILSVVSFTYSMLCSISLVIAIIAKQIAFLNLAAAFFVAMTMSFVGAYVIYDAGDREISRVMIFIINAVCLPVTLVFFIVSLIYVTFYKIIFGSEDWY